MSTITVEHIVIAVFAGGSGCRGILARYVQAYNGLLPSCLALHSMYSLQVLLFRMGYSPDAIKNNAAKKLAGDQEVEGQRKKVTVSHTMQLVPCAESAGSVGLQYGLGPD